MAASLRLRAFFLGLVPLLWFCSGCGQPVREDRNINFSGEGDRVGFQHGEEGVFVAGKDGKGLEKIYESNETLWHIFLEVTLTY